jgi:putative nucleotidyltransferase with HDIG domain
LERFHHVMTGAHVEAGRPLTGTFVPKILVVDDEPAVRSYICECLALRAYECTGVGSAREALAVLDSAPVDVALLDVSMPHGDGVALARSIRERTADVAVVLVTGSRSFETAVEAMRVGVLDYLLKPFAMPELLDAVDRAVDWRREALLIHQERATLEWEVTERATRLRRTFADLEVASSAALDALLMTLNQRNPETLEHARRVARLSVSVAVELGLAPGEVCAIERAALLHDLGKVAIPDVVIHKPGPLTSDELAIMRSHVQIGHDILHTVPSLRAAADIVVATHERHDGSGYPHGLKGAEIPVGARIIAVIDAFDALTWARVYRGATGVDEANAELVRSAGSHFDPEVVGAWLRAADDALGAMVTVQPWTGVVQ